MKIHSGDGYSIDTETVRAGRKMRTPEAQIHLFFNYLRKMRRRTHTELSGRRCVINLEIVFKYIF